MAEGGKILKDILEKLSQAVRPGLTTNDLNKLANELVFSYKVKPAFLNYGGFPGTLCISINNEVVHGVPSDKILKEGDIVSLDMGIIYKGWNLDAALTVPVLGSQAYQQWAEENPKVAKLLHITKESLYVGIKQAKVGNRVGDISHAIEEVIKPHGFGIVRDLVGHGIGKLLHEEPHVPNYGRPSDGPVLQVGMVIAIEPIVTMGTWRVKLADDEFTYVTQDNSWAAHFEHTVAITKDGPIVLTK